MMVRRNLVVTAVLLLTGCVFLSAQSTRKTAPAKHSAAYVSMSAKLDKMSRNGERARPDQTPTKITAEESSAWINEGGVTLPSGVDHVRFRSVPGVITANARVDFDKLTAGRASNNPLLMLFTGIHDIEVVAQARAAAGQGVVNVQTLALDGVQVPRMAMEFFVNRYLKPKYKNVGLDTRFQMPARVDTAIVGTNDATLIQK